MSLLLALTLLAASAPPAYEEQCADPTSERDRQICAYMKRVLELEIRTVETVAVGTIEQLKSIRPQARKCELLNRIDPVGIDPLGNEVSVLDIINASDAGRLCLTAWIKENAPQLEFSEEKLNALLNSPNTP